MHNVRVDLIARRVVIRGRVQGVCFRDNCRREAERLRVTGWVRNESDGSVCAVYEGSATAVEAMIDWSRSGPPHAVVDDIDVTEADPAGTRRFRVR